MMGIEIERKFLIDGGSYPLQDGVNRWLSWKTITQGYIFITPWKNVRVRIVENHFPVYIAETQGFITVKHKFDTSKLATSEWEYEIPYDDAVQMITAICPDVVKKKRHIKIIDDMRWEFDYFTHRHEGLVVAEVEFKSEDDANAFVIPDFVLKEVTKDKRFANTWLANATNSEITALIAEVYSD